MPAKYEALIRSFCSENGIEVPCGFGRNTPGRYAIIRQDLVQPKLVATTWAKEADVVYYIEHLLPPDIRDAPSAKFRVLDFKTSTEHAYVGSKRLAAIGTFRLLTDGA